MLACWIFDWLFQLPDALPKDFFNKQTYPKTIAWRERYNAAIASAKEMVPKPTELTGPDAVSKILKSGFNEEKTKVESDPCNLQEGEEVDMYPIDTGYDRKDSGKLIGLSRNESVISCLSQQEGKEIHIHHPRWNFHVRAPKAVEDEQEGERHGSFEGTDHVG